MVRFAVLMASLVQILWIKKSMDLKNVFSFVSSNQKLIYGSNFGRVVSQSHEYLTRFCRISRPMVYLRVDPTDWSHKFPVKNNLLIATYISYSYCRYIFVCVLITINHNAQVFKQIWRQIYRQNKRGNNFRKYIILFIFQLNFKDK